MLSNTHRTGFLGLFIGGSTVIIAAVVALFKLLADPSFLLSLYWAISDVHHQRTTNADILVFCKLAGALFAVLGALVTAFLMSYYGRPYTVPSDHISGALPDTTAQPGGAALTQKG